MGISDIFLVQEWCFFSSSGGDVSPRNVYLSEALLDILVEHR